MQGFTLGYRPALDGLRGVAILAVLGSHAGFPLLKGGSLGVDVFFVLSGFLITTLLLLEQQRYGRIDLKSFYIRRALRLLPALYAVLLFSWVYGNFFAPTDMAEQVNRGVIVTFFYVANWYQALYGLSSLSILSPYWSLAIEEQFYILWPPLLMLFVRIESRRLLPCFLVVGIIVSFCLRFALWDGPGSTDRLYAGLDTRADSILIGCLIATLFQSNRLKLSERSSTLIGVLGIALLAPLFVFASRKGGFVYLGGFTLTALVAGLLLISLLSNSVLVRVFEMRWLVWVGRLSYGIYLWNFICFHIAWQIVRPWSGSAVVARLAGLALTLLLVSISYYWLERPCLRLKDRLGRKQSVRPRIMETQAT